MLDFPINPNTNDQFPSPPVPGVPTWTWDGEKWVLRGAAGGDYLPLAGGTMLGPMSLAGNASSALQPVTLQQLDAQLIHILELPQFEAITRGFIDGLEFVWLGNQPTFRVTAGACSADDNSGLIVLPQTDIRADALFTGVGNLDTGTVTEQWYHVFAIDNATFTSPSLLISASATAPTMPAGYTKKRRIFSYLTGPLPFYAERMYQVGDTFHWPAMRVDAQFVTFPSMAGRQLSTLASVPAGVSVEAILTLSWSDVSGLLGKLFYIFPAFVDGAQPREFNNTNLTLWCGVEVQWSGAPRLHITTDTSQRVAWWRNSVNPGQAELTIQVDGWVDSRGKS